MAVPVIMPRQGQSVESCILTQWLKQKGDEIKIGDILFAYETDKASFEEEAKDEGVLLEVFFEEGDEITVLTNVAVIGKEGESVAEFIPGNAGAETQAKTENTVETQNSVKEEEVKLETVQETVEPDAETKISPRAKNMAEKQGVPVEKVKGTGPYGRIIERDVEAYAKTQPLMTPLAKQVAKTEGLTSTDKATGTGGRITGADLSLSNQVYGTDFEIKKLSNIRKIIARKMHESLQNSAQLTHHLSADVRKLQQLRKKAKKAKEEGSPYNITLNDMICYAVIRALIKHPAANSHFLCDSIKTFKKIHLGFAVDTPRGLMVPYVKNADDLSLTGLSSQMKQLAEQCRQGSIAPELIDSNGASFTVSNLGAYGVEMFTPVINLPQAGILGVNTIINRPADLGGGIFGFVPYIGLSLTYDHQALDGGPATLFLAEIKNEIENFDTNLI